MATEIPYAADAEQPLSYDELEVSPFQWWSSSIVTSLIMITTNVCLIGLTHTV